MTTSLQKVSASLLIYPFPLLQMMNFPSLSGPLSSPNSYPSRISNRKWSSRQLKKKAKTTSCCPTSTARVPHNCCHQVEVSVCKGDSTWSKKTRHSRRRGSPRSCHWSARPSFKPRPSRGFKIPLRPHPCSKRAELINHRWSSRHRKLELPHQPSSCQ
jgi:hypothetical protein